MKDPQHFLASLHRFREDHPDPSRAAFIMMQFGATTAHRDVLDGVRAALGRHGIVGLRADDKEYNPSLFDNVQTYMHGCGLGVAIFERIEADAFNPNVALEVGYMMAMDKPVCLLKDRTLPALHTDLIGYLYRSFNPLDAKSSILPQVTNWLSDHGLGQLWSEVQNDSPNSLVVLVRRSNPEQFPMFGTTERSTAAIAFRTREQAVHFAQGKGHAHEWKVQVLDPSEAVTWLKNARDNNGVMYVAFNPEPTTSHANASVIPIEVALAIFEHGAESA
jgi:hypothetical protein